MSAPFDHEAYESNCPDCGLNWWLFPPARIHDYGANHKRFNTDDVRCVECKRVYYRPLPQSA